MYKEFFETLCKNIGENPHREGLVKTPQRLEQSHLELFCGYKQSPKEVFHTTFCEIPYDEMIVLKDLEFYSMCEHHLLPFFGKISLGYIPNEKIAGIGDFAKLIEVYARRLQTQENLSYEIIEAVMQELSPKGAMLVCEATHLCLAMRGEQQKSSTLLTSAVRGIFKSNPKTRSEFLSHIRK